LYRFVVGEEGEDFGAVLDGAGAPLLKRHGEQEGFLHGRGGFFGGDARAGHLLAGDAPTEGGRKKQRTRVQHTCRICETADGVLK